MCSQHVVVHYKQCELAIGVTRSHSCTKVCSFGRPQAEHSSTIGKKQKLRQSHKVLASPCCQVTVLRTRHSLVTSSMKEDAMMRSDVPRQMRSKMNTMRMQWMQSWKLRTHCAAKVCLMILMDDLMMFLISFAAMSPLERSLLHGPTLRIKRFKQACCRSNFTPLCGSNWNSCSNRCAVVLQAIHLSGVMQMPLTICWCVNQSVPGPCSGARSQDSQGLAYALLPQINTQSLHSWSVLQCKGVVSNHDLTSNMYLSIYRISYEIILMYIK